MQELTVTSELNTEHDYQTKYPPSIEGNVISEFPFLMVTDDKAARFDQDSDLDIERPKKEVIKIEHSSKTQLALVGRQVWRGALLLADLLIHLGVKGQLRGKTVLEVGAGSGLTSIVASMYADKVICTDIDIGGILNLIKINAKYNAKFIKSKFEVMALDFNNTSWEPALFEAIQNTDIIIAGDVIYDDDLTRAFIATIEKVLNTNPPKTLYLALEKRYVFTLEHMDSVAPCYETFLSLLDELKTQQNQHSKWTVEQLPTDFPQYFTYDRLKHLVLWKITSE